MKNGIYRRAATAHGRLGLQNGIGLIASINGLDIRTIPCLRSEEDVEGIRNFERRTLFAAQPVGYAKVFGAAKAAPSSSPVRADEGDVQEKRFRPKLIRTRDFTPAVRGADRTGAPIGVVRYGAEQRRR